LEFRFNEIKKGDLQGNYAPESVIKTPVDGNVMVHHKTVAPNSPTGDYRVMFPSAMMVSNILYNQHTNANGEAGVSLKIFMDMHGNYDIKNAQGQPTTDEKGFEMVRSIHNIEKIYCDSIDDNEAIKRAILAPLKFGAKLPEKLKQPLSDWFLTSIVKRPIIDDDASPDNGMPDMTKGESVKFQLWTGRPKEENRNNANNVMIGDTGAQLFCKVYDHTKGVTEVPLKHWNAIKRFVYTKGDSKSATGQRPFRLQVVMVCLAPSMFASSEKQTGELQFKVLELHIFAVDYKVSTYTLPEPRKRSIMDEIIRSRDEFVIQRDKPVEEPEYVDEVVHETPKRSRDQFEHGNNNNNYNDNNNGGYQLKKTRLQEPHMRFNNETNQYELIDTNGNIQVVDPRHAGNYAGNDDDDLDS